MKPRFAGVFVQSGSKNANKKNIYDTLELNNAAAIKIWCEIFIKMGAIRAQWASLARISDLQKAEEKRRFDRSNLSHLWGVRGMHLEGINNNALPMAVQIDVIWRLRCRQRCWSTSSASVLPCYSISSLKHLWLPHKGSKSKIEISPSPGKSLKPPWNFPNQLYFCDPCSFYQIYGTSPDMFYVLGK